MLDVIKEWMRQDDATTVIQLVRILEDRGYKVSKSTLVRTRRMLGWIFHGSRYCQLIWSANKKKRLQWAMKNRDNTFEDVMWMDESMIRLVNHRTFSYIKVGTALKPKPKAKHAFKVMVWAGISCKGSDKHLRIELLC